MEHYEQIIRWIARLVVLIYLLRLSVDLHGWPQNVERCQTRERRLRWLWTTAFVLHVVHVLLAFHWIHHWSHAAAYEHTALRTGQVTGWYWGGGVWINYLFTGLWLFDVIYSWKAGLDRLPRWYVCSLHALFLFLLFNATVVFGPRGWSYVAVPLGLGLLTIWLLGYRKRSGL